jgi:hypothetical protein
MIGALLIQLRRSDYSPATRVYAQAPPLHVVQQPHCPAADADRSGCIKGFALPGKIRDHVMRTAHMAYAQPVPIEEKVDVAVIGAL